MTPGRTTERVSETEPPGRLVANPASCTSILVLEGPLPSEGRGQGFESLPARQSISQLIGGDIRRPNA
jgi:hypothetical protein